MTDVPYGRGGSPLQNLILAGHTETQLTALKMVEEMDAGPVYAKRPLSLEGKAQEIYENTGKLSFELIEWIIANNPEPIAQEGAISTFKRRKPVPGLFVALLIISLRHVFLINKADKLLSEVADYNLSPINLNRFAGVLKAGLSIKKTNSGRDVCYISYEVDKSSFNAVLNKCIEMVPSSIRNALENLKVELK